MIIKTGFIQKLFKSNKKSDTNYHRECSIKKTKSETKNMEGSCSAMTKTRSSSFHPDPSMKRDYLYFKALVSFLFIFLYNYLSLYLFSFLFICLSIIIFYLSIFNFYLFIRLFYLFFCLFICLFNCLSICLSIFSSVF